MKNSATTTPVAPPSSIELATLLQKKALATRLGVSVRTLEGMVASGVFPPGVRIGRFLYWTEAAIEGWHQRIFSAQLSWKP